MKDSQLKPDTSCSCPALIPPICWKFQQCLQEDGRCLCCWFHCRITWLRNLYFSSAEKKKLKCPSKPREGEVDVCWPGSTMYYYSWDFVLLYFLFYIAVLLFPINLVSKMGFTWIFSDANRFLFSLFLKRVLSQSAPYQVDYCCTIFFLCTLNICCEKDLFSVNFLGR